MIKSRKYIRLVVSITVLAAVTMLSVSCRGHKHLQQSNSDSTVVVDTPPAPPAQPAVLLDTIQNAYYKYYSANFSCEVDGIAVTGQIRIVHDSAIWISVNKIIEVGRVLITPTKVQGYVKLLSKCYDGDFAGIAKRWGLDLDFATLEAMLTGNCPPHCVKREEPTRNGDQVTLQFHQKSPTTAQQRQLTLLKHFKTKKIQRIEMSCPSQQRTVCSYAKTQTVEGQTLPTLIDLTVRSRVFDGTTQLKLEKIALNKRQPMPFSIPKRYKKF